MTKAIEEIAKSHARSDVEVIAVNPERGPVSIESYYDEHLSAPGVLEEVKKGIKQGVDGIIIACFGDPALYACREVADVPVVGIAEASMLMACTLGHRFTVLTILERFKPLMEEVVKKYGLWERCASIRSSGLAVLEIEKDRKKTIETLTKVGRKAIEEDKAEVLCLGCAGMAGFDKELEKALKIPVIDPVVAALMIVVSLVDYGKKTSKAFTFQYPEKKEIRGYSEILQP